MSARSKVKSRTASGVSTKPIKGKRKKGESEERLKRLKDNSNVKIKSKKDKSKDKVKVVAKIPSGRGDSSSNWKALLQKQGKKLPVVDSSFSSVIAESKKSKKAAKKMESSQDEATTRSRSTSQVRCESQLSMASEGASLASGDNLAGAGANNNPEESEAAQKVKKEFRALGLSGPKPQRQSRPPLKSPRSTRGPPSQQAALSFLAGRTLKKFLPRGLNEFGFFDYSHYGAIRTPLLPGHQEFMVQTVIVGIDCEMVGVGPMKESALARVSIINRYGYCLYDRFVRPKMEVTDYRTQFSGIRESDMKHAIPLHVVVKEVADLLKSRILVGHSLKSDLSVLFLNHQKVRMRDTAFYFKKMMNSRTPKLKTVVKKTLGIDIQQGEHSSITDAQAAMALYLVFQNEWEASVRDGGHGVDILRECTEEFNKLQELRSRGVGPPLPAPHYFPSTVTNQPQLEKQHKPWYGFSQESNCSSDLSMSSSELSFSSEGAVGGPMSFPYIEEPQLPAPLHDYYASTSVLPSPALGSTQLGLLPTSRRSETFQPLMMNYSVYQDLPPFPPLSVALPVPLQFQVPPPPPVNYQQPPVAFPPFVNFEENTLLMGIPPSFPVYQEPSPRLVQFLPSPLPLNSCTLYVYANAYAIK